MLNNPYCGKTLGRVNSHPQFSPAFLAVFWYGLLSLVWHFAGSDEPKRIDCGMAEFHPDYTPKMREQCRLVRSGGKLL